MDTRRLLEILVILAAALFIICPVLAQESFDGPPLVFQYRDDGGQGHLAVYDLGPDEATGGRQIRVRLQRNGVGATGSGIMLPLEKEMPFRTLITFAAEGPGGRAFFFQGQTISGITVSGQGTYHPTGRPERSRQWSIVLGGPTSGIRGLARQSPIFPVERLGQPNTAPLPGAIITVQPLGGGDEIARTTADREGRFDLPLPPGTYLIVPLAPDPEAKFPRGERQRVRVEPGEYTRVIVEYDTAIR